MVTRALAVSLLLFPSLAFAQQGVATVSPVEIGRTDCPATTTDVTVTFQPLVTGTFQAGLDKYRFFASTSACSSSTVPSSGSFATDQIANATSVQTLTVSPNALRSALATIPPTCSLVDDVAYYVCIYLVNTTGGIVGTAFSGSSQSFQLAVPPPPVITNVAPAAGALEVSVAKGTTTATEKADTGIRFEVEASATGFPTVRSTRQGGPTIRVEPLEDLQPYAVIAYAYSSAGNESQASAPPSYGTPLPFDSFWEAYQNAGGREQGGCGGGAGALSPLAPLTLALRRRRR